MRAKLFIAVGALVAVGWAVPSAGTAPFIVRGSTGGIQSSIQPPVPVRLRVTKDRGLLLTAWLNGRGPYFFVVDTGAGMNLITQRVADDARLTSRSVRPTVMGGLTGARTTSNREAVINQLALGDPNNPIVAAKVALVVSALAPGIDGVLDPTDIYAPSGYSIDLPNQRMEAAGPVARNSPGKSGAGERAVVPWLRGGNNSRPFVRLGDGRLALIDTGSGFGLAVNSRDAVIVGARRSERPIEGGRDIAGGAINSRRVSPTTISIGELVLRSVPTDILFGVDADAPVILGRDVLYPFKITFDPQRRLIEFITSEKGRPF